MFDVDALADLVGGLRSLGRRGVAAIARRVDAMAGTRQGRGRRRRETTTRDARVERGLASGAPWRRREVAFTTRSSRMPGTAQGAQDAPPPGFSGLRGPRANRSPLAGGRGSPPDDTPSGRGRRAVERGARAEEDDRERRRRDVQRSAPGERGESPPPRPCGARRRVLKRRSLAFSAVRYAMYDSWRPAFSRSAAISEFRTTSALFGIFQGCTRPPLPRRRRRRSSANRLRGGLGSRRARQLLLSDAGVESLPRSLSRYPALRALAAVACGRSRRRPPTPSPRRAARRSRRRGAARRAAARSAPSRWYRTAHAEQAHLQQVPARAAGPPRSSPRRQPSVLVRVGRRSKRRELPRPPPRPTSSHRRRRRRRPRASSGRSSPSGSSSSSVAARVSSLRRRPPRRRAARACPDPPPPSPAGERRRRRSPGAIARRRLRLDVHGVRVSGEVRAASITAASDRLRQHQVGRRKNRAPAPPRAGLHAREMCLKAANPPAAAPAGCGEEAELAKCSRTRPRGGPAGNASSAEGEGGGAENHVLRRDNGITCDEAAASGRSSATGTSASSAQTTTCARAENDEFKRATPSTASRSRDQSVAADHTLERGSRTRRSSRSSRVGGRAGHRAEGGTGRSRTRVQLRKGNASTRSAVP